MLLISYWILKIVLIFLSWTFLLYWIHRFTHKISIINKYHQDHHIYINQNNGTSWHWSNFFLYNDTIKSTIDLWITEVIPTLIISVITGYWWLFVFYYLWAALLQEVLEHNSNFDRYPFTSGRWHLMHHKIQYKNFGLFIPLWDKLFRTEILPNNIKS
jgi:sterol desaturase/sphingolipid hydroxylase (fatty acid hydroxylase superfamily)